MFPTLRDGQTVEIEYASSEAPFFRPGDIVCYLFEKRCLIHRVIGMNRDQVTVAGEGGVAPHSISREAVLGLVRVPWWNRGWRGLTMYAVLKKVGILGKFLSLGDPARRIPSPEECDRLVAGQYGDPEEVRLCREDVREGLTDWEERLVDRYLRVPAKILDIGCGSGREALALAKRGFEVTAIDRSAAMVSSARQWAEDSKVAFRIECVEASSYRLSGTPFDAVYFSLGSPSYGLIAGHRRRVELLRHFRTLMKPGGLLMFSGIYEASPGWWDPSNFARIARSGLGWLRGEGFHGERGDFCYLFGAHQQGRGFHHVFSSPDEVAAELGQAGFEPVDRFDPGGAWVCRPLH
jgi:SAM-dependent methyltransferase